MIVDRYKIRRFGSLDAVSNDVDGESVLPSIVQKLSTLDGRQKGKLKFFFVDLRLSE